MISLESHKMPSTDTLSQEKLRSIEQAATEAATASPSNEPAFSEARESADETIKRVKEKCERVGASVESLSATVQRSGTTIIRYEGAMSEAAAEALFGLFPAPAPQQKRQQAQILHLRHLRNRFVRLQTETPAHAIALRDLLARVISQPVLPDWMRPVLKEDQRGQSDVALDEMFDHIDPMLSSGKYSEINAILAAMPVEGPSLTLMMGLLSITRPAAQYLPSRKRFFDRVYRLCKAMRRDAETLLGGLR